MLTVAFAARNALCMSLEKTAHLDNVALLREQLQSLQSRLSTLQGWRMRELTDEQVESIAEEVRDAMRACLVQFFSQLKWLTVLLRRRISRRITSQKIGRSRPG